MKQSEGSSGDLLQARPCFLNPPLMVNFPRYYASFCMVAPAVLSREKVDQRAVVSPGINLAGSEGQNRTKQLLDV